MKKFVFGPEFHCSDNVTCTLTYNEVFGLICLFEILELAGSSNALQNGAKSGGTGVGSNSEAVIKTKANETST